MSNTTNLFKKNYADYLADDKLNEIGTAENIANNLKQEIIENRLQPGDRLREVEIAKSMKSSRTPVREAFRILQSEGFLKHIPRCGVIVAELRDDELRPLWEVRSLVEGEAAFKAASHIKEKGLKLLHKIQEEMEQLPHSEYLEFARLDSILHTIIARSCNNTVLEETIERLQSAAGLGRSRSVFWEKRNEASCKEHKDIIRAISMGDAVLAKRYMQIHFEKSTETLLSILESSEKH